MGTFSNSEDQDEMPHYAACYFMRHFIRVYTVCKGNKKCHKHVTNAPKGIGLA